MCNFPGNNRRSRAAIIIIIIIVLDDASKNIPHARSWDVCPRSRHKKMDHGSGVRENIKLIARLCAITLICNSTLLLQRQENQPSLFYLVQNKTLTIQLQNLIPFMIS
jgi:hypothetical protein